MACKCLDTSSVFPLSPSICLHANKVLLQDLTDEQGAEVVREAFKQGINFFDTSPYYGVTRSETVSWLCCVPSLPSLLPSL